MSDSYEQGIEAVALKVCKYAKHVHSILHPCDNSRYRAEEFVSAFLSVQPTLQWCRPHENTILIGEWADHCTLGDWIEGANAWDCHIVPIGIVEQRRTPNGV